MKHIPYWTPSNIRYQSTKFNHLGNLAIRTGVFLALQYWKTLFWAWSRGQWLHTADATITLLFHRYFNVYHNKHEHITVCLKHKRACADTLGSSKCSKVKQGYGDFLATLKIKISTMAFTCVEYPARICVSPSASKLQSHLQCASAC
jgi:hypothetical protein